jgi:hypothetical protein
MKFLEVADTHSAARGRKRPLAVQQKTGSYEVRIQTVALLAPARTTTWITVMVRAATDAPSVMNEYEVQIQ